MYEVIKFSEDMNLDAFYDKAKKQGYENNSNKKIMVDSLKGERASQVFIMFYNNNPVGSVACHSFDIMGDNSYRICARVCVLTKELPELNLRTINHIKTGQHYTAQFLIPACIDWCPKNADLYITSNKSEVASQRLVHQLYMPALEESGQVSYVKDVYYRGHVQSIWKFHTDVFFKILNDNPKW